MGKVFKNILVVMLTLIILAGVAAGGYALGKRGLPDFKPVCEHVYGEDSKCEKCGADKPADEEESSSMQITNSSGNSRISLTSEEIPVAKFAESGISPRAENARTITARVTPIESEVIDFTWSADWLNAQSTWARGKNLSQYFSLTADENNPLSAVAVCYQSFGEPILITCTYDHNADISKSCRVDYVKFCSVALDSVGCNFYVDGELDGTYEAYTGQWDGDYWLELYTSFSPVGTVQGEFEADYVYFRLLDNFSEALYATSYYQQWQSLVADAGGEINFHSSTDEALFENRRIGRFNYNEENNGFCVTLTEASFIEDYDGSYFGKAIQEEAHKYLQAAFFQAALQCAGDEMFEAVVVGTYTYTAPDGKVIFNQNITGRSDCFNFNTSSMTSVFHSVSDVELSDDNLYFY